MPVAKLVAAGLLVVWRQRLLDLERLALGITRDMTYLPALAMGLWFHLYLILDLCSRKIVGWDVHDSDTADHAAHLLQRKALAEGIAALTVKPVLHGDNGSTLKATTVHSMLH